MHSERTIKTETEEPLGGANELDDYATYGSVSTVHIPPDHPDLRTDNIAEVLAQQQQHHELMIEKKMSSSSSNGVLSATTHYQNGNGGGGGGGPGMSSTGQTSEIKPTWFPSAKGRSIVWEHITWVPETQRAACNYCNADFQIKGGTSALLRHLKTIHPAAINFDPENPPPVVRRKKKKIEEDYTVVTDETRSYVDNLLEQFMHNDNPFEMSDDNLPPNHQHRVDQAEAQHAAQMHPHSQNRAGSEIDEVIRSLQQENGDQEPDDLRKLLGIDDDLLTQDNVAGVSADLEESMEHQELGVLDVSNVPTLMMALNPMSVEDERNVPSSSSAPKKRKVDDSMKTDEPGIADTFKHGKYALSLMSAIRRPTPHQNGHQNAVAHPAAHLPPTLAAPHVPTTSSAPAATNSNGSSTRYNAQAAHCLDFEAKVLYNQSMKATVLREEAMAMYYRMKSRKLELEVKKMERELGETPQSVSPEEHEE